VLYGVTCVDVTEVSSVLYGVTCVDVTEVSSVLCCAVWGDMCGCY
jgi:hypothetical protein